MALSHANALKRSRWAGLVGEDRRKPPAGPARFVSPMVEPMFQPEHLRRLSTRTGALARLPMSDRMERAMEILLGSKEATASDVADGLEVSLKYAQQLLRALLELGRVRKIERGNLTAWAIETTTQSKEKPE